MVKHKNYGFCNTSTIFIDNWISYWLADNSVNIFMSIIFYCFTSHVYYFRLKIYNKFKTIIGFSFWFFPLEMYNKKIIGSVFVICKIININVAVTVISLAFGLADNSYLDIDNSAYHNNLIQ